MSISVNFRSFFENSNGFHSINTCGTYFIFWEILNTFSFVGYISISRLEFYSKEVNEKRSSTPLSSKTYDGCNLPLFICQKELIDVD